MAPHAHPLFYLQINDSYRTERLMSINLSKFGAHLHDFVFLEFLAIHILLHINK